MFVPKTIALGSLHEGGTEGYWLQEEDIPWYLKNEWLRTSFSYIPHENCPFELTEFHAPISFMETGQLHLYSMLWDL